MKVKMQTCEFVCASDIVPRSWVHWFWGQVSEGAPFSFGDNNRTLITASRFAQHCRQALDDSSKVRKWLKEVEKLGETYIDIEN